MVFVCWCVSMCVCVSVSGYVLIQVLMCVWAVLVDRFWKDRAEVMTHVFILPLGRH